MSPELKKRVYAYNAEVLADEEAAKDLRMLLDNMPPGQVKNLLKDAVCGAILRKYGITGEGTSDD